MVKRVASGIVCLSAIAFIIAGTCASYMLAYFYIPGPLTKETTLIIPQGTPLKGMAEQLGEAGVIRQPYMFWLVAGIAKGRGALRAGEYAFTAAISPRQIVTMLKEGRSVVHRFTVPEGETVHQIITRLMQEKALMGDIPPGLEEGSLLPDTYFFTYGDQRAKLIERMQSNMQNLIQTLWPKQASDLPFKTAAEAIVLASIVEKETGLDEERGRVAAVFINRMRKNMRLQSDPTVIYAITQGTYDLKRPLTLEDLRVTSPYNTYVIKGLPPYPIGNPGKASLAAVLNPPTTNEYYFVASGKGGHYFASSLAEHNRNVQQYRQYLMRNK